MFRKFLAVWLIFWGTFSLLVPGRLARAHSSIQPDASAIDAYLRGQVTANRLPGLAVAIVQGERVIFSQGYGEAAPGRPVTPQTQFYLGSVSKSFTALAALQLVEQGKLELDAPVQKYLPWFRAADPQASAQITVRHLLNHTSGLSEKGDPNAAAFTGSLEAQGRLLQGARLTAPVGSQFQYYNQNYRLVGLLIETASGQPYADYLREHVFIPLGMAHTTADPAEAADLAQGYSRFFGFAQPRPQPFIPGALPSGYIISSAEDMAKYLLAQIHNRRADGTPLLSPQALAEMRTPPAGIESEYGMGWLVMENGNTLAHGGALDHFQSFMALGLKEESGFVLLFNQNSMENMLFENNAIRAGVLLLLQGKKVTPLSFGWIGWLLAGLAGADLLNHLRLYRGLRRWKQQAARRPRLWVGARIVAGILLPGAVFLGLPPLAHAIQGGAPNWAEPLKLMPDVTLWLLLGMGLTLGRNILYAVLFTRSHIQGEIQ